MSGLAKDHTLLLLFTTFALVIALAVAGTVLVAATHASDTLFRDAMNIIGIGGPAGAATNSAARAIGDRFGKGNGNGNGNKAALNLPPQINLGGR